MATRIPYLDETWSPVTGCGDDMVSPGCLNCYARRMFGRNLWKCPECDGTGQIDVSGILYDQRDTMECPRCDATGHQAFTPTFHSDRLDQPLHWRKPRRIGVSFMGDLFHEAITDEQRDAVLARIIGSPQHTFMLLTKRAEAARTYLSDQHERCAMLLANWHHLVPDGRNPWPLPNVHLGVTVCNQEEADRNIPLLLDTPAAVRWVSLEPMLGPVDLRRGVYQMPPDGAARGTTLEGLDLVILGGETGPGAWPMQPEWALDVYRQCKAAGVPFWFKSMGSAPHKKVWDWPNTLGAEMQATHELPVVRP